MKKTFFSAECSSGYASKTGLEPCLPCPKGTYQFDVGKTFCLDCPGEGNTLDIASTDVSECQGKYDNKHLLWATFLFFLFQIPKNGHYTSK